MKPQQERIVTEKMCWNDEKFQIKRPINLWNWKIVKKILYLIF